MVRFADDLHLMSGQRPNILVLLCWKVVSPVLMAVIVRFVYVRCDLRFGG